MVRSSWFRNYWKNWGHKKVDWEVYKEGQTRRIERMLLTNPVVVAFFDEVPDEILGWACLDGTTLHYVYVKAPYRKQGIGSKLVEGAKCYSHNATEEAKKLFRKNSMQFNPYKADT